MDNLFLEDYKEFFTTKDLIFDKKMTNVQKLNCIGKLSIILFLILLFVNYKFSLVFLVLILTVILIIFYYIKMKKTKVNVNKTNSQLEHFVKDRRTVIEYFVPKPTPRNNIRGNFTTVESGKNLSVKPVNIKDFSQHGLIITPENRAFCNDAVTIDPPSSFAVNLNQNLTGNSCHPVTRIAPVVIPPTHDLEYWKDNNFIIHSAINSEGVQKDMYLSGYGESTCCGYLGEGAEAVPREMRKNSTETRTKETYTGPIPSIKISGPQERSFPENCSAPLDYVPNCQIRSPIPVQDRIYVPTLPVGGNNSVLETYTGPIPSIKISGPQERSFPENCSAPLDYVPNCQIRSPIPVQDRIYVPTLPVGGNTLPVGGNTLPVGGNTLPVGGNTLPVTRENFTKDVQKENIYIRPRRSGEINQNCGYNPEQIFRSGLPSNFPAGNCEQDPRLKQYNENLFTQIVTPGVYTRNQINEPINSNIGISFQQQFEPVTCERNEKGLLYTQHDPRIVDPSIEEPDPKPDINPKYDNVFDPRFYGYGTSYRSYIDETTGQPRFMYDDINAIRMPNYITRSKVDFLPYADTYGPMEEGSEYGNIHNPYMRAMVQDSWLRNSLQFRDDITERRMRKINADAWQRRQAPLGPAMTGY